MLELMVEGLGLAKFRGWMKSETRDYNGRYYCRWKCTVRRWLV